MLSYLRIETNQGNCVEAGVREKRDGLLPFEFPIGRVQGFMGAYENKDENLWVHLHTLSVVYADAEAH